MPRRARSAAAGARVVLAVRDVEKGRAAAGHDARLDGRCGRSTSPSLASVREFAARLSRGRRRSARATTPASWSRRSPVPRTGSSSSSAPTTSGTSRSPTCCCRGVTRSRGHGLVDGAPAGARSTSTDLNWERKRYRRWRAYGQTKLANLLFTAELQRRLAAAGSPVVATAAHPGYAATNLQSHSGSRFGDVLMAVGNRLFAQERGGRRAADAVRGDGGRAGRQLSRARAGSWSSAARRSSWGGPRAATDEAGRAAALGRLRGAHGGAVRVPEAPALVPPAP